MRIGIRGHDLEGTGLDALVKGLKGNRLDALQLVCHKSFEDVPYTIWTNFGNTIRTTEQIKRVMRLLEYFVCFAIRQPSMKSVLG